MYKVDIKTLNEITETIDALITKGYYVYSGNEIAKAIKLRAKAKKLSQNIKDNYTKIKL